MQAADTHSIIVQVALASPLRHTFDYLLPVGLQQHNLEPGMRVKIPFRKKIETGVVIAVSTSSMTRPLKDIIEILDHKAILPPQILELVIWASHYYHHSINDCVMSALPALLRQGAQAALKLERLYMLTSAGIEADITTLSRAPQQAVTLAALKQHPDGCTAAQLKQLQLSKACITVLVKKNWVQVKLVPVPQVTHIPTANVAQSLDLNMAQQQAIAQIIKSLNSFQTFLLYGVTGSGKTEVYLQAIEQVLAAHRQALVLVPEIGLTPQTIERFQQRFKVTVVAMHSGLTERERLNAWLMAKSGGAAIIIGTRSAIFTPLLKPGIIIVDEEHDLSFKQQDGFRYSARDLALVRAKREGIPVVLGSATPSIESLYNAQQHRYQLLKLPERAGNAIAPRFNIIDIRNLQLSESILAPQLLTAMNHHLEAGGQTLLFLNRRGFAPVILCHSCGWIAHCQHCDAHLTLHQALQQWRCHHCGACQKPLARCPTCSGKELIPIGIGTERLEQLLLKNYSAKIIVRIDRDSTRHKGSLEEMFTHIHSGQSKILLGTQMLAKGHHFADVTLVGILNADSGLYSVDFRATERLAQLIMQVAGRAGRADKPGEVFIQTHHPQHPLLQELIQHGYLEFAKNALQDRLATQLPPYSYLALIKAEANNKEQPLEFLNLVAEAARQFCANEIQILGPIPAPMERKGGYFRAQLLLQATLRPSLQDLLHKLIPAIDALKLSRKVRWAIDVDPLELI